MVERGADNIDNTVEILRKGALERGADAVTAAKVAAHAADPTMPELRRGEVKQTPQPPAAPAKPA